MQRGRETGRLKNALALGDVRRERQTHAERHDGNIDKNSHGKAIIFTA
jgi:hypothetical protein